MLFSSLSSLILVVLAQTGVAVDNGGQLYSLDMATGLATPTVATAARSAADLGVDGTGQWWLADGTLLQSLDRNSGQFGVPIQTMCTNIRAIAFDGAGLCYAISREPVSTTDTLFLINMAGGVTTQVGDTGYQSVEALWWDSVQDELWGWATLPTATSKSNAGLIKIDIRTGNGKDPDTNTGSSQYLDVLGMFSDPSGGVFGVGDNLSILGFPNGDRKVLGPTGAVLVGAAMGSAGISLKVANLVAGQTAIAAASPCTPLGPVAFAASVTGGGPTSTPFGIASLSPPFIVLGIPAADPSGYATVSGPVPPGGSGRMIWIQALDITAGVFSNGIAATIQ